MKLLYVLMLISSISFLGYGIAYLTSTKMKSEFKRFGLEKLGVLISILQILGASGLLVGFIYQPILLISAGGLSLLMLLGVAFRIKFKDSLWVSLPAIFFMILNACIFFISLNTK